MFPNVTLPFKNNFNHPVGKKKLKCEYRYVSKNKQTT